MSPIQADPNSSLSNIDLHLFFNSAINLFCITGFDGYFKKINPAITEILGYTHAELLHRPIYDFLHPEDREFTAKQYELLRTAKPPNDFENRYLTKGGQVIWLSWILVPHPESELIFAVAKDITTKKLEELNQAQIIEKLSIYQQRFKDLVYTALHDLRSPAGNMLSIFDIYDGLKTPIAPYTEPLAHLKTSIADLKLKMDDYLDRLIKETKENQVYAEVNLGQALSRAMASLSALIAESQTTIAADLSPGETIYFDEAYLESIFLNLISNSIKYARPGIAPVIEVLSKSAANHHEIVVKDNGRGFDLEKHKDRIFQPQQRFHSLREGKGLGLYLVKKHLLSTGGDITVNSQPDRGTTFTLFFKKSPSN